MQALSTYQTFLQALNVINAALEANRDSPVVRPVVSTCEGRDYGVAVFRDDPDAPHDYFTIRLESGEFVLVEHGRPHADAAWKVSELWLREVATNPKLYLDHPGRLGLDWLKDRVGGRRS